MDIHRLNSIIPCFIVTMMVRSLFSLSMWMTGNDPMEMERLKEKLATEFETKDLGPLRYFLGMEVTRNKSGISISQRKYILDLLKEIRMLGCKLVDALMDPVKKIGEQKESTPVDTGRSMPSREANLSFPH